METGTETVNNTAGQVGTRVERRKGKRFNTGVVDGLRIGGSGSGSGSGHGGSREHRRKRNRIIKFIVWIVQIAAEVLLGYFLVKLGMLSTPMLAAALVVLVALAVATFFLFGLHRKHNHSSIRVPHIIGFILAAGAIGVSAFGASVTNQVIGTVTEVTRPMLPSSTVAVYVLADDSAVELDHARDYTFGFTKAYDTEHTMDTIQAIEDELLTEITKVEEPSVFEMVDALLNGETRAIVLNKAYASILDDVDEYAGFSDKTKVIWEKSFLIETPKPEEKPKEEEEKPKKEISEGAFIIYLSGSDTRSYYLSTSRSDVNIIAAVNPTTKEILLVNTPRDYYVPISVGGGAYDKLTHCGVYGIQCSADTLANLYGIDIDYTAQINFTGMETLIDVIGGITVHSDVAFTTFNGYYIDYGENYLDGAAALGFARERYNLSGGDNDRGRNQMKVLAAVINKLTNSTTLLENYSGILGALGGMFATDMSYDDIAALVKKQLSDGGSWTVNNYATVGMGGSSSDCFSMPGWNLYVMYINENAVAKASYLIEQVMTGEHLTPGDMY